MRTFKPHLIFSTLTLLAGFTACHQPRYYDDAIVPCQRVVSESYVHKYGVPVEPQEWATRGQSGKVICQLNNGIIQTKSYCDGLLHGVVTYSFPHREEIEKVEFYERGSLQRCTTFTACGHPLKETQYLPGEAQRVTLWYDNGSPQCIETVTYNFLQSGEYYNPDNQIEARIVNGSGERVRRDAFGQLEGKDTFENGALTSTTTFYPNGSPKEVIPYRGGSIEGERRVFRPDGAPESIEEWSNGVQHGKTRLYVNGELSAEVPYYQGNKHGMECRYRDNGETLAAEINWSNHTRHGPSYTYIEGQEPHAEWFHRGKPVSKTNYEILNTVPVLH